MEDAHKRRLKQEFASLYDRAAPIYDRIGPRFFSHFGQRLVDRLKISLGSHILDVATGRGALLFPAAEACGADGKVHAVDLSWEMVRATNNEVKQQKLTHISIQQMDAEQLGFADKSVDYVLCGYGLAFFPDLAKALTEYQRVLKPRGKFGALTWLKQDDRWSWQPRLLQPLLTQSGPLPSTWNLPNRVNDPKFLRNALNAAGFQHIEIITDEAELVYADEYEWWKAEWSHSNRLTMESLSPESLALYKATAFLLLQKQKQPDGIHRLFTALSVVAEK